MSYVYFTMECVERRTIGMECGTGRDTLIAPEGFDYEWRREGDADSTVLSREQKFVPEKGDVSVFNVAVMDKKNHECRFDMRMSTMPQYPKAVCSYRSAARG